MYDDLCVNVVCDLCKVFVVFFKFLKFCFIKFYLGCWNMGFGNKKKRYRICKYVLGVGKKVSNIMIGGE